MAELNWKRALFPAACAYAIFLALFLAIMEWRAETHWFFTILLFAPAQFFSLPAFPLGLLGLWRRDWRTVGLMIGCVLLVFFGYMHSRSRKSEPPTPQSITLITHNVGEGNRQQFYGFVAQEKPDIILMQDARNRAKELAKLFPDFNVAIQGEFACVSRYLIQNSRVLEAPKWRGRAVLARYEIVIHGKSAAVYSVHLPTPRNQLSKFLGARTAIALFGNEELPGGRSTLAEWNAERVELYRQTATVFAQEKLPFIVAGDFNMPSHGLLYHRFLEVMDDAFAQTGDGPGFTFPGNMKRLGTFIGPWIRIDYIYAGRGWKALSCAPEPGLLSQHRAVAARLLESGGK